MPAGPDTLDYAPRSRPALSRAKVKLAVLVVLTFASFPLLYFGAQGYTSKKYWVIKLGMTRDEVDRHMWAYTTRPDLGRVGKLRDGQSVVRYELFSLGDGAAMLVVYDANGVVVDGWRMFD